jgi:hypothetical protein
VGGHGEEDEDGGPLALEDGALEDEAVEDEAVEDEALGDEALGEELEVVVVPNSLYHAM